MASRIMLLLRILNVCYPTFAFKNCLSNQRSSTSLISACRLLGFRCFPMGIRNDFRLWHTSKTFIWLNSLRTLRTKGNFEYIRKQCIFLTVASTNFCNWPKAQNSQVWSNVYFTLLYFTSQFSSILALPQKEPGIRAQWFVTLLRVQKPTDIKCILWITRRIFPFIWD